MQDITPKEWQALMYTVDGLSDVKAYKKVFPNATDKTANSNAFRYFRKIRDKLTPDDELEIYNLGRSRFYNELDKRLNAETPIFYQGKKIDTVSDNAVRYKATELLAKIHRLYDHKEQTLNDEINTVNDTLKKFQDVINSTDI